MKNVVIKSKGGEHGKKVIAYLESIGFTNPYKFIGRDVGVYYGSGDLGSTKINCVSSIPSDCIEIFLPEDKPYPKVMEVSHSLSFGGCYKRVVFMEKKGRYIAWKMARTLEEAENQFDATSWPYARDIQSDQIVELTIQDISDGKGKGVPAHLIRIKK